MQSLQNQLRRFSRLMRQIDRQIPILAAVVLVLWQGIAGAAVAAGDMSVVGARPASLVYMEDGRTVVLEASQAYCNFSGTEEGSGKGVCPECAALHVAALPAPFASVVDQLVLPVRRTPQPPLPEGTSLRPRSARDPPVFI